MVMCHAGVNAAVVMFDLEAMGASCRVMIRAKVFELQVTWPPPHSNERVGEYEFLGGEAEAKQMNGINDF